MDNTYSNARKIMLFEMASGGHHSTYIRYLVNHWVEKQFQGELLLVVSPDFFELNKYLSSPKYFSANIKVLCITPLEASKLNSFTLTSRISRLLYDFCEWNLFCKYADLHQVDHATMMFFDHIQIPVIFGRKIRCRFSSIYFRPSFHYDKFPGQSFSFLERCRNFIKKEILNLAIKNSKLEKLYCLDPLALNFTGKFRGGQKKFCYLPDPVPNYAISKDRLLSFKEKLGINSDKKILLFFGGIDARKGLLELLSSLDLVTESIQCQLLVLVVGSINKSIQSGLERLLDEVSRTTFVQVKIIDQYVPEDDLPYYFEISNVVALLYQKHVGMSGVLLHALAFNKPVLSTNYGLVGELVRVGNLGVSIDASVPHEIAMGITRVFTFRLEDSFRGLKFIDIQTSLLRFCEAILLPNISL